jgi:hypothetical protein
VKTVLKGKWLQDVEDIKKTVTEELNALSLDVCAAFRKVLNDSTNVFKLAEITLNRNTTIFYFPNESWNVIANTCG